MRNFGWGFVSDEEAIRTAVRVRQWFPQWSAKDSAKSLAVSCAYLALTPFVLLLLVALIPVDALLGKAIKLSDTISSRLLPWQMWPIIRELHRNTGPFDVK
jgi:hypothetical protein